jgi:hypothetical protein
VEQNDVVGDDGSKKVSVVTTIEPSMKIQEPENVTAPVTPSSTKTTLVSGKKRGRQQQQQHQRNMEPSFATENHDDNDVATDGGSKTITEKKKVKKKATPKSKTVTTVNSSVNSGDGGSLLPLPKKKKNSATTSHQCITERDELPKLWTDDMAKANKSYSTFSCCCLLLLFVVVCCCNDVLWMLYNLNDNIGLDLSFHGIRILSNILMCVVGMVLGPCWEDSI